jgi:hypothetical protein
MTAKRCIGFGEHEGICAYSATVQPALLWCQRCEALRIETITAQMDKIAASFEASSRALREVDGFDAGYRAALAAREDSLVELRQGMAELGFTVGRNPGSST